jgi:hypothetical protein
MRRYLVSLCALVSALGISSAALAASHQALSHSRFDRVVARGAVKGTVVSVNGSQLIIQTSGRPTGVINQLIHAASRITREDYPYVYGGGHAHAGRASIGIPGPGYNGHRRGFDCSGSVAAVLVAGGLWPAGSGVPSDAGMISELKSWGLIAHGVGTGPTEVTLYDDPGQHIFMNVDGRFFGTSDGAGGGNRRGGAGWLNDGSWDAYSSTYRRYHFVRSALKGTRGSGHAVAFQIQSGQPTSTVGKRVWVNYQELGAGVLVATAVRYTG